jgi:hypothetical protein
MGSPSWDLAAAGWLGMAVRFDELDWVGETERVGATRLTPQSDSE